jgi:hypothetical protein
MPHRERDRSRTRGPFAALAGRYVDIPTAAVFLRVHPSLIRRAITRGVLPARVRYRLVSHPRNWWTRYYEVPVVAVLDHLVERVAFFGPRGRSRRPGRRKPGHEAAPAIGSLTS